MPNSKNANLLKNPYLLYDEVSSEQKGGWEMNQIGLVGRLTKDPVLRQLSESRIQANFTVAVNRNFRNYKGDVDADFLYCTAWGKLAEHIVKYCGKGSLIGINGRLQSRSYVKEDNARVYMTEVIVEEVRFYALKPKDSDQNRTASSPMATSSNGAQQIAESTELTEAIMTEAERVNASVTTEFILPREEPHLPVR